MGLCGAESIWTHITGFTGGIYIFDKLKMLPISLREWSWKKCPERSRIWAQLLGERGVSKDRWNNLEEQSALRQYQGPERKDVCDSRNYRKRKLWSAVREGERFWQLLPVGFLAMTSLKHATKWPTKQQRTHWLLLLMLSPAQLLNWFEGPEHVSEFHRLS